MPNNNYRITFKSGEILNIYSEDIAKTVREFKFPGLSFARTYVKGKNTMICVLDASDILVIKPIVEV